jgi:hypothetical protein
MPQSTAHLLRREFRYYALSLALHFDWRLTPQFSGGALTYAARRERIMK